MTAGDSPPSPDVIVNTRGMFCPAPIIKLSEAIRNVDSGRVVELVSDDPAIEYDLPAWCKSAGHTVVASSRDGADFVYRVQKKIK
jgi:tRNA 2-thiouridine synthesizing protein A